jgi:anti-sigma regulatory factor (Ser/Thr protein kinase)
VVGLAAGTEVTVTLRLPPTPVHVRTARLVAAAMARRSGVAESLLDEVRLAVGEACARAVRLHERHEIAEGVLVEFAEGARFGVSVLDRADMLTSDTVGVDLVPGRGDPGGSDQVPWVDPSGDALGLALLGAVVQDLSVDPDLEGGTRVAMFWPVS